MHMCGEAHLMVDEIIIMNESRWTTMTNLTGNGWMMDNMDG